MSRLERFTRGARENRKENPMRVFVQNEAQRATLRALGSVLSEMESSHDSNNLVIVEGYGKDDGLLSVGMIDVDGDVRWACGERELPGAPEQQTVRVFPWTWRDGRVHLEVRLATFASGAGDALTHLDGDVDGGRFVTACGARWWGVASASGLGASHSVTCEACQDILRSAKLVSEGVPGDG